MDEKKQPEKRKLTSEELIAGPSQTPEQLDQTNWFYRKQTHVDTLTEPEIKRVLKEKEDARLLREKEMVEVGKARQIVEKEYWSDIEKSCMDGDASERFARCIIRMANQNLLVPTLGSPVEKQRRIVQMLRLHGIMIKESKERVPLTSFMQAADVFVSDPYVRKGDVVTTRRSMFPEPEK